MNFTLSHSKATSYSQTLSQMIMDKMAAFAQYVLEIEFFSACVYRGEELECYLSNLPNTVVEGLPTSVTRQSFAQYTFDKVITLKRHLSFEKPWQEYVMIEKTWFVQRALDHDYKVVLGFHALENRELTTEIHTQILQFSEAVAYQVGYYGLKNQLNLPSHVSPLHELQNNLGLIGISEGINTVRDLILRVAPTDSTVIILGETGTGKELVAKAIHKQSNRKDSAFVKINCAAIPFHLLESELFGHEKGAFTGAVERKIGKFELANNGTLFLDEIGDMPHELQAKILRVLQEKSFERVGGNKTVNANVRIITATHCDLEKLIEAGTFRQDLYYRLNVFPIQIPALRERVEDIPVLVEHFVNHFARTLNKHLLGVNQQVLSCLMQNTWQGNVRELQHVIERACILSKGKYINKTYIYQNTSTIQDETNHFEVKPLQEIERSYIIQVLQHCQGKVFGEKGAAQLLGLPPTTLLSKMKKLHIQKQIG
ncbi:sigma-54 interaction domain-containing protein [Flectobacillus longus]|uniref:sigma-54 interaction domain-containing protein n=1 Tax=Flectobacillus longus TaxID=2984207 RepID=UPI0024B78DA1|nr:sigma-54 dependent transcriptional regulator [Flectobacillus longus]MDI9882345.1 sigma-54 dependent transcriptional regulator [Flectobacillus longus]